MSTPTPLSEQVLGLLDLSPTKRREVWPFLCDRVPASHRKDDVVAMMADAPRGSRMEPLLNDYIRYLYTWLEGYEAAIAAGATQERDARTVAP